ncbi:MAG TPA: FGGY family carbohydrate kinase, partial [Candidatus Limnocylindrales bacterium]
MDGHVIGIDVGTTATKAVMLDPAQRIVAESASIEHATHYPADEPSAAEQDPDAWWAGSIRAIREVLVASGVAAREVGALAVSSQAPCVVPLGRDGRPLRRALLWMDRRSDPECRARAGAADEVKRLTGNSIDPFYAAPKLAWLLGHEPELARRIDRVVMANGYVVFRLTGEACVDTGHAGLTLLAELREVRWSAALADIWGVPLSWLPPIAEPAAVVGRVTAEAAAATGLLPGTPVMAGLLDAIAASLEAGLAQAGDLCEMTGQSTVLNAAVPYSALANGIGALTAAAYPIPGLYLLAGTMVSTGGILRWFRDQFGLSAAAGEHGEELRAALDLALAREDDPFALLDRLAASAPAGSNGLVLLPYFLGERSPIWDSDARGVLVGLSMATTRADVVRAILEGTAYGVNHNLEEMRRLGIASPALRVVGGGARGRTWNQIKADVTGLPVEVPAGARGATVGSALLAAAGV